MEDSTLREIKAALLAAIPLLLLLRWYLVRRDPRWASRLARLAIPLGLLGLLAFFRFGVWHQDQPLSYHDIFHYYLGAKYSDSLGYERLYHCTLIALDETDPRLHRGVTAVRDLSASRERPKGWFLGRAARCKRHFSASQWRSFRHDVQELGRRGTVWRKALTDKGYNPSPVWSMVGGAVARVLPLDRPWSPWAIGGFDLLLLAGALALVGRACGLFPLILALMLLGGWYDFTRTLVRGGFLRLDWLACLIAALAALKLERNRLAGGLLAYAAAVRLFPLAFAFGPAVLAGQALLSRRAVPRPVVRFLASLGVTGALLVGLSVASGGGVGPWREFGAKLSRHTGELSVTRVGLKYLLIWRGERTDADIAGAPGQAPSWRRFAATKDALWRQLRPWHLALCLVLAALLAVLLARRDLPSACAFSFPLIFLLTDATFYYNAYLLAVAMLCFAAVRDRTAITVASAIALFEVALFVLFSTPRNQLYAHFLYSGLLAGVILVLYVALAADRVGPWLLGALRQRRERLLVSEDQVAVDEHR